jgi:P22 coat protein - gene protein 5
MRTFKALSMAVKALLVFALTILLIPVKIYHDRHLKLYVSNVLNLYDPLFYAQEALIALEMALGMANAVYRGYDSTPQQKGSIINISKPGVFTTAAAPSVAQDLLPGNVSITLNNWREVKMALSDKELTYTKEKIITDHIRPAAYALAAYIDSQLNTLYNTIPWRTTMGATPAPVDLLAARAILFARGVPMNDGNLFAEVDGATEAALLGNAAFAQWQGSGQEGVSTQVSGVLGRRYGITVFANQNTPSHTTGIGGADVIGAAPAAAKGDKAMTVTAVTISKTGMLVAGDTFTIAGHTQHYVITATATSDGAGNLPIAFLPGLEAALNGAEVVTFEVGSAAATKTNSMLFHRNAFALAMAPLSTLGDGMGARIETITDPVTGLSIRSRMYYMPDASQINVALDVLFGFTTLDANRAVRMGSA